MNIFRLRSCIVLSVIILIGTYTFADAKEKNYISTILQLLLWDDEDGGESPVLNSISIDGLIEVSRSYGAQYTCTAYYSDGSSSDVTSSAQWSDDSSYASIDNSGYLTTDFVTSEQIVNITAKYAGAADTQSVTIVLIDGFGEPPEPKPSRCESLIGTLEIQVLVGPAEPVGLEPLSVGNIPFATISDDAPFLVQGNGPISYEGTLNEEWGTYTVSLEMDISITGECSGDCDAEQLDLVVEMTGEQLVVVDSEGFHGEYPWAGTQTREVTLPLQEGATAQGEGWVFVLHLS